MRLYLLYRVALGVALLLVYFGIGRGPLGTFLPGVFQIAVHLYLVCHRRADHAPARCRRQRKAGPVGGVPGHRTDHGDDAFSGGVQSAWAC